MKRFIFWLIMLIVVTMVSYYGLVLTTSYQVDDGIGWLVPSLANLENGFHFISNFFRNFGSYWDLGFNIFTIPYFALMLFLIINLILVICLVMGFLFTAGSLDRIKGLYACARWFFLSAVIFTASWVYVVIYLASIFDAPIMDMVGELPWQTYIPIGTSFVLMILAFILKRSERFKY